MVHKEEYYVISIEQMPQWNDFLKLCGNYDTYHTAEYHLLAKQQGEGEPKLFCFSWSGYHAALPFLLRPLSDVSGLEKFCYFDCSSVYGYPGVVTSISPNNLIASEFKHRFQEATEITLKNLSVISLFSRQNPLIESSWILRGKAQIIALAHTLSINLKKSDEAQLKEMSKGHRYDIRKARKAKVIAYEVDYWEKLDDLYSIYNETMERNKSSDYYRFSIAYFKRLKENLGDAVRLYVSEKNGRVIAVSVFLVSNRIIQYHLSGTLSRYMAFAGSKVIIDEIRKWGANNGYWWLHLGGGVGSTTDSLYRFKSGFTKCHLQFELVKWVVNPKIYAEAAEIVKAADSDFFPIYRNPINRNSTIN